MTFSWLNWLKRTFPTGQSRRSSTYVRRLQKAAPTLELLEERVVPAAYFEVTGFTDGAGQILNPGGANPGTAGNPFIATTLRAAVNASDADSGSTILIPDGTYVLTAGTSTSIGELPILANMTILPMAGNSGNGVVIDQQVAGDRVFDVDPFQTGTVNPTTQITFTINFSTDAKGLTIEGGDDTAAGSTMAGNGFSYNNNSDPGTSGAGGGGLYLGGSYDTVGLTNVTIAGDSTAGGGPGGGAAVFPPTQGGGAISVSGSHDQLNFVNTLLNDDTSTSASGGGGGIYVSGASDVLDLQSGNSLTSNTATLKDGGGIDIVGATDTLTSVGSTFGGQSAGNSSTTGNGGAVAISGDGPNTLQHQRYILLQLRGRLRRRSKRLHH